MFAWMPFPEIIVRLRDNRSTEAEPSVLEKMIACRGPSVTLVLCLREDCMSEGRL